MSERSAATVSDAALAVAVSMRRFDAALGDADIEALARRIDANWALGARLNPAPARLSNADEPVTRFALPEPRQA